MERLQTLLNDGGHKYELIRHETAIHSAQDGADYFGIDIGQTAPTLILKAGSRFVAAVVSGDRGKISFDALAERMGCSEVRLVSRKEVKEVTGCEAGSVPLVGLDLPFAIDRSLFRHPFIYGGTGDRYWTLKIEPQALERLNRVELIFD